MFKRELEIAGGIHWAQQSVRDNSCQFPMLVIRSLEVCTLRGAISWFGLVQENREKMGPKDGPVLE